MKLWDVFYSAHVFRFSGTLCCLRAMPRLEVPAHGDAPATMAARVSCCSSIDRERASRHRAEPRPDTELDHAKHRRGGQRGVHADGDGIELRRFFGGALERQ